jgi:hypothetical protein
MGLLEHALTAKKTTKARKKREHEKRCTVRRLERRREKIRREHKQNKRREERLVPIPRRSGARHRSPTQPFRITAPSNFNLIENADEMLQFFSQLQKHVYREFFLDMSGIETITADAVLYLLARFQSFDRDFHSLRVSGNLPSSRKCRDVLLESGFGKYVKMITPISPSDENILAIRRDHLARNDTAREVIVFARRHLGQERSRKSKMLYNSIMECMANTKQHAYSRGNNAQYWWLVAWHEEREKCVHFAFLDTGQGIPATIRRNMREKFSLILEQINLPVARVKDCDLIQSALQGQLRTRTGESFRGRGLPDIRSYQEEGHIRNLRVIANRGLVDVGSGIRRELDRPFKGTLLCWDFI